MHSYMCMYTDVYKTAAAVIGQDTNGLTGLQLYPTASDGLWKQGEQSGQAACALQERGVHWRSLLFEQHTHSSCGVGKVANKCNEYLYCS